MYKLIATWGYVGLLRPAPGTWGSLAALPLAVLLHDLGGFPALAVATIAVFFAGLWATTGYTRQTASHDPSEVVVDEVVGQWLTFWPLSAALWWMGLTIWLPWPGLLVGFLLFRLFDILKPWPVSWADQRATPFGVMLDDVLAGTYAALVMFAGSTLFHGFL